MTGVIVPCLGLLAVDSILTVAGVVLGARLYAAVALVLASGMFLVQRRRRTVAVLSAVSILLVTCVLYSWPFSGRKALVRSARSIQPGMSRVEVGQRMAGFASGHPYAASIAAFLAPSGTDDIWHHGGGGDLTSFDHCIVSYDTGLHVRSVELILD